MYLKSIIFTCLVSTVYCLPLSSENAINDVAKASLSVDEALALPNKVVKLEETTTTGQLFNNNDGPEEDKIFKLSDDDLIDASNLSPSSKQASGGITNVQGLIDQTNVINSNLQHMINDMTNSKRPTMAALLKLVHQNGVKLNTSLVRLNQRVSNLPIIGNPQTSASSSSSSSSSVSNSVSNATYNAAAQINGVVNNIRTQLNNTTNELNNLIQRMRTAIPGAGGQTNKPAATQP